MNEMCFTLQLFSSFLFLHIGCQYLHIMSNRGYHLAHKIILSAIVFFNYCLITLKEHFTLTSQTQGMIFASSANNYLKGKITFCTLWKIQLKYDEIFIIHVLVKKKKRRKKTG